MTYRYTHALEEGRVERELRVLLKYGGPRHVAPRVQDLLQAVLDYGVRHPRGRPWDRPRLYHILQQRRLNAQLNGHGRPHHGDPWHITDPRAARQELQTIREEHGRAVAEVRRGNRPPPRLFHPIRHCPPEELERVALAMRVVLFYAHRKPRAAEMADVLHRHRVAGPDGAEDFWAPNRTKRCADYLRELNYPIRLNTKTGSRPLTFRDEAAMADQLRDYAKPVVLTEPAKHEPKRWERDHAA
jgi:hypothetical protein